MASNRNQHFVPQFYLQRFSANENSVPIYNVMRKGHVSSASIRGQCSNRYFYGRDDVVDGLLRELEGVAGCALKDFPDFFGKRLSQMDTWEKFLCFIVTQYTRVPSSADDLERYDQELLTLVYEGNPPIGPEPDEPDPPPPALTVADSLSHYALIFDLVPVLLEAPENCALITLDHPVVRTNFAALWGYVKDSSEYMAAGLVIYYPLSPRLGLLLADRNVYRVGESPLDCFALSERDTEILNCLQVQNCESILVGVNSADAAKRLVDRASGLRRRGQELIHCTTNGKPIIHHMVSFPGPLGVLSCLYLREDMRFLRSGMSDFDERLNPLMQTAGKYIWAVEFEQADLFRYHEFATRGRIKLRI